MCMMKSNFFNKGNHTPTRDNQLEHGILNAGLLFKVFDLDRSLDIYRTKDTEI
jgi:hypothetical protein